MNIHDKLKELKNQISLLESISTEIIDNSTTKDGREQILNIANFHGIFEDSWNAFGRFRNAMEAIYREHDSSFDLPQFKTDAYGLDWVYTMEHGYLLLKVDTSRNYNAVRVFGLSALFDSYKETTAEHTPESTYFFVMDCITYLQRAAQKMLSLPIFNSNEFILSSLMYHYYLDYQINSNSCLRHVMNARGSYIHDDFRRMVFETNGSDPLSVRGSLPILSHLARKKTYGHYRWSDSDPSEFVRDMRSNKALNLREAFAEMERRLDHDPEGSSEELAEEITFQCTVGICTQRPHYNSRKKFPGISTYPVIFFNDSLQLGLFATCMDPRRSDYGEQCIGWVDFESSVSVYDRHEGIFNCLEDDIVDTLEDNYNFLLEKLPNLDKDRLRNDMLDYIIEGR